MKRLIAALTLGLGLSAMAHPGILYGQTFHAEGSDTIFGVGARHVAMGGTGTATADDPLAIFYNPALLARTDRPMISLTRQLDATLRPFTFAGATLPLPLPDSLGLNATIGFARYNRVHARSSGLLEEDDMRSVFLRYLLPGMTGDYDGKIDSKTLVNRFALGVAPSGGGGLSLGVNLDYIDCKTETCGVEAGGVGWVARSVHATALSLGASASYQWGDRLTLGASWTDIDTTLTTRQVRTDANGTRNYTYRTKLPSKLNLEAAWQATDKILVATGWQKFWGNYGSYTLNFETLHFGAEYETDNGFTWRGGLWAPLQMSSSLSSQIELPVPAAPTAGLGWKRDRFSADISVYAHPVMTLSEDRPVVSGDLTIGWRF